jgi:hypothetical protein
MVTATAPRSSRTTRINRQPLPEASPQESMGAPPESDSLPDRPALPPPRPKNGSAGLGGTNLVNLCPDSPFRPVAWRWQLALQAVDWARHLPPWLTDRWVDRAVQFISALKACRTPRGKARLARRMPATHRAYQLSLATPSWQRWELEARLLAGETVRQIAGPTGLDPGTIKVYEQLFFNVFDRLKATSYIRNATIGPKLYTNPAELDIGAWWKLAALSGGSPRLDQFIEAFGPSRPVAATERGETDPQARYLNRLECKVQVALVLWPRTPGATLLLMRLGTCGPDPTDRVPWLTRVLHCFRRVIGTNRTRQSDLVKILVAADPAPAPGQ